MELRPGRLELRLQRRDRAARPALERAARRLLHLEADRLYRRRDVDRALHEFGKTMEAAGPTLFPSLVASCGRAGCIAPLGRSLGSGARSAGCRRAESIRHHPGIQFCPIPVGSSGERPDAEGHSRNRSCLHRRRFDGRFRRDTRFLGETRFPAENHSSKEPRPRRRAQRRSGRREQRIHSFPRRRRQAFVRRRAPRGARTGETGQAGRPAGQRLQNAGKRQGGKARRLFQGQHPSA